MIRIVALLTFVLLLPFNAWADERILEYRSDIHVHASGELTVTETIRVRAEGQNIRRGIYRDFPTRYRDRFGNFVTAGFKPISARRNGENEAWHTENRSNGVRVYLGRSDRMLEPGIHEYTLVFNTNRQLGFFDDFDELYFNAIGFGWAFPIDRGEATVRLPFDVPADRIATHAYLGRAGSRGGEVFTDFPDSRTVRFATGRPLAPREGLTVAVGWPKGLIAEPGLGQRVRWFLSDNAAALILLIGLLAPLAWYLWAWNKVGRDPRKGVIIPRFKPPQGLSPAACRYVKDMSFGRNSFTAAVISLAVKGQLVIQEDDDEYTLKRVLPSEKTELTPGEKAVLEDLLPRPGDLIELKNENHTEFQAARRALKKELGKEYQGRLFNLNLQYLAVPILMSVTAATIAAFLDGGPPVWISFALLTLVLHGLFLLLIRAPTVSGRLVMDEIEGFRMYLDTAEQDRLDRMKSPEMTPEVFETFLPYAYALGVENNWCQRFARELPEETQRKDGYRPGWYRGRFRGARALHHLGDDFSSSFSSSISAASTPPGSSSGSGGGGSAGGGGGGGGGGGW